MSVIYEALKKAEGANRYEREMVTRQKKTPKNKNGFYLAIIVLASITVAQMAYVQRGEKKLTSFAYHPLTNEGKEEYGFKVAAKFKLQGIVRQEDGLTAYVNSEKVSEGDSIGTARVIKIDEKFVEIDDNGQIIMLVLQ